MKTTVIYHSADYDGIFCREIAKKFLPDAELIGWDFGDAPILIPDGQIYVMDLPVDRVFGFNSLTGEAPKDIGRQAFEAIKNRLIWIDHHKSSIETHPKSIAGYRIDGVAACRLAWQWFTIVDGNTNYSNVGNSVRAAGVLPMIQDFKNRTVSEPLAVRLAGEYDIWDHRDNDADIAFQFGLDSQEVVPWPQILDHGWGAENVTGSIVADGRAAMRCCAKRDGDIMRSRSFRARFEGLELLCLNTARCNSNTFSALDKPETGHDALCGFFWNGKQWTVSLYHAAHRKDIDLSEIAKRNGGGGHRGACGFITKKPPFLS